MFGKGRRNPSANDRFIVAAGVKAGNLKGRGTAPKTAPLVEVKKGAAAVNPVNAVPSLSPRTINRSQVRFPATVKAGKFPHVQGGRKG